VSYAAQQWALEQKDVKGIDKWVLFMLAYRDGHDEPHGCWPSLNRMATDCGVSRRTIIRAIQRLVSSGKVMSEERRKCNGDRSSNRYSFPQVWKLAEKSVVTRSHQGSVRKRKLVVTQSHPNLKELTKREPSRSALPVSLPIDEQRQLQNNFLAAMKKIAGGKSL
jgi:DNA-binding transcriptional MocR family regulator